MLIERGFGSNASFLFENQGNQVYCIPSFKKGVSMNKALIVSAMFLVFLASLPSFSYAVQENDKSIGTTAGEAAHNLKEKTDETAKVASAETEKASKQFAQIADEALQKLNIQFQAASKSFQEASQELSKKLQEEIEKFKQSYNKPTKA